ncbi:unnamed protein product [Fusarium graminearum]|nr:hypothetical protein FG05_30096 [Fusarium graminearum]CAG1976967.1 unnamed protein product [Fusarium graminearum]
MQMADSQRVSLHIAKAKQAINKFLSATGMDTTYFAKDVVTMVDKLHKELKSPLNMPVKIPDSSYEEGEWNDLNYESEVLRLVSFC